MSAMAAGRGRKVATALIVLLVVLVGLFLAVDRVAAYAASQELASQAQKELASREVTTPSKPTVVIGGFPFLTQVVRGRYDKVTIHARSLTGRGVTVDALDVTATGIHAKATALMNGRGDVTADNVTGTARVGWAAVTSLIKTSGTGMNGVSVSALPDGRVEMKTPVSVLGVTTNVVATGTVGVSGSVVHISITRVQAQGGDIPPGLSSIIGSLKTALSVNVNIPPLPYHLKISSVRSTVEGIVVTAYAQNVALATQSGA
jgi:LmeA-like phospholipid-binding